MGNFKKFALVFSAAVLSLLSCAMLSSCGIPNPPQQKQLIRDLPSDITAITVENPFDLTDMDVYEMEDVSLSIEKRQTNEKEDFVYCVVDLKNQYYYFTKYVKLNYTYYDQGGWILDGWEYYQDTSYQVLANPFDEEQAALKWSYDYSTVSLEDTALELEQNSITYEFYVENQHKHAVTAGNLTVTYTFNGTQWIENADVSDVLTEWNIVGDWEYLQVSDSGSFVYGCFMEIDHFDQTDEKISGYCRFYFSSMSFLSFQTDQYCIDYDLSNAKLTIAEDRITMEWGIDSLYIGLDESSCEFFGGGHANTVKQLKFIDRTVDQSDEFDSRDVVAWKELIDTYFSVTGTGDQTQIVSYMMENGVCGDDMKHLWGCHATQYKIGGIHHSPGFTAMMYDEVLDELEMLAVEFQELGSTYDYTAPFDSLAEVYVAADFAGQESTIYKFCFIRRNEVWSLFFIDDDG